jgi:hypothetical protein
MDEIYYQPILMLILGLFLIFFIKGRKERKKKILSNCKEVTGMVADIEMEYSKNGGPTYFPVVRFEIDEKKVIMQKYSDGNNPSKYTKYQDITIQYWTEDPKEFLIKRHDNGQVELLMVFLGIGMILYSAFLFLQIYNH